MTDNAQSQHTTARAPFDDVDADIILHTSDHVDFRVFRLILTLSSPFFQGMFTLPQSTDAFARPGPNSPDQTLSAFSPSPSSSSHSKPPSVDVPEDSVTLDTLLRILYPNAHAPAFRDLYHARSVAVAASKYVMSAALDSIASAIESQYAASHPLQVYMIACRMGWESVARSAAMECLDPARMPDYRGGGGGDGESDSAAGAGAGAAAAAAVDDLLHYPGAGVAYHRLETYREACRAALAEKLDDLNLFDEDDSSDCENDSENADGGISAYCLHRWAARYLTNIKHAMWKCPRKETLNEMALSPGRRCGHCSVYLASKIATVRLEVASRVDDVLSEVELCFRP